MKKLAVLITFVIAIAMAIVMDCAGLGGKYCAGPLAAGAAVKVGQNFFLQYGGALFTIQVDMLLIIYTGGKNFLYLLFLFVINYLY